MKRQRLTFPYPQLYPELEFFGDRAEQSRALRRHRGDVPWWAGVLCAAGVILLLRESLPALLRTLPDPAGARGPVALCLLVIGTALVFAFVLFVRRSRRIRRRLRRDLVARGVAICVRCGYDLRGSPGCCPECGGARE